MWLKISTFPHVALNVVDKQLSRWLSRLAFSNHICCFASMALSYLLGAKRAAEQTHDMHNVNPFHDPVNPQYGIQANAAMHAGGPPPMVMTHRGPGDPGPLRGTAAELRQRRPNLRGSFHRPASAPPPLIPSTPPLDRLTSPAPSPPRSPRGADTDDEANTAEINYDWNADRLDKMHEEVYTNVPTRMLDVENKMNTILAGYAANESGPDKTENQRRAARYGMSQLSSPSSSAQYSPAPKLYTIGTPTGVGVSHGSGARGSTEGGDTSEMPKSQMEIDAFKNDLEKMNKSRDDLHDRHQAFQLLMDQTIKDLNNMHQKIFTQDLVVDDLDAKLQQLEDASVVQKTQLGLIEQTSKKA